MSTSYRPGSEGAADQKMIKKFKVGISISLILAIILLLTVPLLKQEAGQTGSFSKAMGWLSMLLAVLCIVFEEKITDKTGNSWLWGALAIVLIWFPGFFLHIAGGV